MKVRKRGIEAERLCGAFQQRSAPIFQRPEECTSIAKLFLLLLTADTLEEISTIILQQAKRVTESTTGCVGYHDPQTGTFFCPISVEDIRAADHSELNEATTNIPQRLMSQVFESCKPVLTNDFSKYFPSDETVHPRMSIQRFLAIPRLTRNNLVVLVAVANSLRDYDENDFYFIDYLSTAYAMALDRRMSEVSYREIFDAVNDAILLHDRVDGAILDVNRRFTQIFGYSSEQAKELKVANLSSNIPPYTEKAVQESFERVKGKTLPPMLEWLCKDSHGKLFWVEVSVRTAVIGGKECVLSIVRDITERKQAQEELKEKTKLLEIKSKNLKEANTALRVLLKQREEDKTELEDKVLSNVKQLLIPYIDKLKNTSLDHYQVGYLDILESNLQDLISPFSIKLSAKSVGLTPTQILLADFIRAGRSNKEIAESLNLSITTVETHRRHIRKRLGLKDKKSNLRTYLLCFE